ncbi:hypothetical protein MOX01_19130 [Microbacterium oxydans]|nr:hypothetical protein MOX01_19130 [Microbacterium oxydans]
MADARSGDADAHLAGAGRSEVDVDELDRRLRIAEDNSFHDILRVSGDADDARRLPTWRHSTNVWIHCVGVTLCMIGRWLVMSPPWRDTSKDGFWTERCRARVT